jgi:hypothetical protein
LAAILRVFAAILCGHGSRFIFYGSRFIFSQNRTRWRAASSEAFALFLSQGVGARRRLFPSARPSARRRLFPSARICVRAVALCVSCEPASRAKPSMRCEARLVNVFTTKPRATRSFGVRYARRPRRTREGRGRGERYARTIISALHVS